MDLIQIKTPDYLTAYAESRIGGRFENQDSYGYSDTPFGFCMAVCDGMGGGPGGKTASVIAVNEIIHGIREGNKDDEPTNIVIKAIRRANMSIIAKTKDIPELSGMGSTCAVLLINENCSIIAHVGDSRVYQLRGKSKEFRTFDHSMVFELVKQKVITEEQARLSAQSNVITRALGVKPDVEVEIAVRPYLSRDRFMICTDGIHGAMSDEDLVALASGRKQSLGALTDDIATLVDGKGVFDGGGHDNLTIALIETKINSKMKIKMTKRVKMVLIVLSIISAVSIAFNIVAFCGHKDIDNNIETSNQEITSVNEESTTANPQNSKKDSSSEKQ